MRPAAQILLAESKALRPLLEATPPEALSLPTVCTGWSVRDVLAHCGAALTASAAGSTHSFSSEDNERDVEIRRSWALEDVLAELFAGYDAAADAIDRAGGALDGVGLGEWIHGGDVRAALDAPRAYTSEGIDLALPLLVERSVALKAPRVDVTIGDLRLTFGVGDHATKLSTNVETFVRLCGGRNPDPDRYELHGIEPDELVLFR